MVGNRFSTRSPSTTATESASKLSTRNKHGISHLHKRSDRPSVGRGAECRNALLAASDKGLGQNGWDWTDSVISTLSRGMVQGGQWLTGGYSNALCSTADGNYSQAGIDFIGQQATNASYAGAATGAAGLTGMTAKQAAGRCAVGAAANAAIEKGVVGSVTVKGAAIGCLSAGNIKPSASTTTKVTSWASEGATPDLNPGRWVMVGDASRWNFLKSGLIGAKITLNPFSYESANVPFTNYITAEVEKDLLKWPGGAEFLKGLLGQRVIKP
jgi:hypothetical protein